MVTDTLHCKGKQAFDVANGVSAKDKSFAEVVKEKTHLPYEAICHCHPLGDLRVNIVEYTSSSH